MLFAHDTEMSFNAAAALVNTARGSDEELPDVTALDWFVEHWGWTGATSCADAVAQNKLEDKYMYFCDMRRSAGVRAIIRPVSQSWQACRPWRTRRSPC